MLNKDPFGQAILDFVNKNNPTDIKVDSNITEDETIPVQYLFRNDNEFPEKEIIGLNAVKGKVLDVGSGSGCHSLYLQNKGVDVTALDYSKTAVEAMRIQGIKKVSYANYFLYNKEKYDTLLLLMNGLGIMGTIDRLDQFFKHSKSLLNKGGVIIGESTDIIYMFMNEDGSADLDLNNNYYGEMEYQMTYKNIVGEWFPWLYVSFDLLSDSATKNGFSCEKLYSGEQHDYLVKMTLL